MPRFEHHLSPGLLEERDEDGLLYVFSLRIP
jgi:hypothetical protein